MVQKRGLDGLIENLEMALIRRMAVGDSCTKKGLIDAAEVEEMESGHPDALLEVLWMMRDHGADTLRGASGRLAMWSELVGTFARAEERTAHTV